MSCRTRKGLWDWLVLTELLGADRCRSFHVFARNTASFFPQLDLRLKQWLSDEAVSRSAKPVSLLPFPENCELGRIRRTPLGGGRK